MSGRASWLMAPVVGAIYIGLLAPLVVVQPALATGLLVLMFLAERMLGERAGRSEYLAMSAIVLGVIGAGLTAPPNTTHSAADGLIAIVLAGVAAIGLLPYMLRALHRRSPATMTMVGAGFAFESLHVMAGGEAIGAEVFGDALQILEFHGLIATHARDRRGAGEIGVGGAGERHHEIGQSQRAAAAPGERQIQERRHERNAEAAA